MERQRATQSRNCCGHSTRGTSLEQVVNRYSGCNLPLAISTVPMQEANWGNTYCIEDALKAGTVFPELYLPFIGSGR